MEHTQVRKWRWMHLLVLLALLLAGVPLTSPARTAQAATSTVHFNVVSARNEPNHPGGPVNVGTPVPNFKFIVTKDDVGDPSASCSRNDPGYPASCKSPARRSFFGTDTAPVVTGDQGDSAAGVMLPDGKYLVSILADDYKIDGEHFSIPSNNATITVKAQPYPLPLATIRARIFNDNASVNGQIDIPGEDGLAGFEGHINDVLGPVTTDWFGNPLCTTYQLGGDGTTYINPATGKPIVTQLGGKCISDANGDIVIPNMGPNRYTFTTVPPNGTDWVQTTTLEGNHDWDIWPQEGSTGYDTEALIAGEPFPMVSHGFARPMALAHTGNGAIKGRAVGVKVYVPPTGGLPYPPSGYAGAKIDKPIDRPWVALSDLNNGDQEIYMARGNADGTFDIRNVPDGDYQVTVWDGPQEYILDLFQTSVQNGQTVDLGNVMLSYWFTKITGTVFIDTNGNGKQDAGERGLPNQPVLLKTRNNSVEDQGTPLVTTDVNGHYVIPEAYPLGSFLVEEVYNDRFQTTGMTFQADNQPNETTILGTGVDINFLPIIGLSARIDWGVKPYAPGTNGGIVGTVTYDTTRNELDPRFAATEDYQPGIPNFTVNLYKPVPCGTDSGKQCVTAENGISYEVEANGSYIKSALLNQYTSEKWQRPNGCITRDADGNPVDYPVLPTDANKLSAECIEAPLQSLQVGTFGTGSDVDFASNVDGNYGFGDGCFSSSYDPAANDGQGGCADTTEPTAMPAGDYLVEAVSPNDANGHPLYKVTREEDVNVFNGDQFTPQVPPPPCVGALHTVDVAGAGTDGPNAVENAGFVDAGGSPYEGQDRPLCDTKLVTLQNTRSIAPNFNFFTDVPIPGRLFGLVTDDLNLSVNPNELLFGEKAGVPNMPVGFYDYTGRLVTTVLTDKDGYFDVQLPSVSTYNCPLPAGPCPNVYRLVGNDPGTPNHLNPTYNPQFRVITTNFQVWPGLTLPADLAPTQIGVTIEAPGSQTTQAAQCNLAGDTPQLFAVSKPYVRPNQNHNVTITGQGFGSNQGHGKVTLGSFAVHVNSWSDTSIKITIPDDNQLSAGAYQLNISADNGQSTVNGLTFHVLGSGYNPQVYEVGPGKQYSTIQSALDAAASRSQALVVVYPGANDPTRPTSYNPRGAYYENVIMHSPVKLQGVGPGGVYADGTPVPGSAIDGILFGADGDAAYVTNWYAKVNSLTWSGNQNVYDGSVVYVLAQQNQFTQNYKAAIDGFDIQGGDQLGFPNNINGIGGLPTGQPAGVTETQGGGIFANAYARYLQITNNVLKSNGGAYGGAIRLGTPDLPAPNTNNHNDHVKIANNRMFANGGTNLAGAVGLFNGSDNYEIASNDLCGNASAEYGGAISHYGLSPNGKIHDNRIWYNRSYDEGAGIMIAGSMPTDPNAQYGAPNGPQGAGPVDIYNNLIQANLSNDDGGGLRFLQAGNFPFNVANNMIVSNVSTHEGGGVAIDDAPNVRFVNNTVMNNITTATAATSDGTPAPAGLSTGPNSAQLQPTLPGGSPAYSKPLLFNSIFWDNRAGSFTGGGVGGIGLAGDPNPINYWDLGSVNAAAQSDIAPTNSILQVQNGVPDPSNQVGIDPQVVAQYPVSVDVLPWRNNLAFNNAILVAVNQPITLNGNYHLLNNSPAKDAGAANKNVPSYQQPPATLSATPFDIDNEARPSGNGYDIGADEINSGSSADLAITKDDGQTSVNVGSQVTYAIAVTNNGPNASNGATVSDNVPTLTSVTWTCSATTGSSCVAASGNGNTISTQVNLINGGTATITARGTLPANTSATSLANTATVAAPGGTPDPNTANNSATDTDTIVQPTLPALVPLDNFNRANATRLGGSWSQLISTSRWVCGGASQTPCAALRVNNNQGYAILLGQALWNNATTGFGANQGAAFTFANTTTNNAALMLKANGGNNAAVPINFICVQYQTSSGGRVVIATTTNGGLSYATRGTLNGSFANGNTLSAVADATGTVYVWKTAGSTTTFLGSVSIPTSGAGAWSQGTGGGRIGVQLPTGARVDNFSGGPLP